MRTVQPPVDAQPLDLLRFHVDQAQLHLAALRRLFPALVELSDEEREYTNTIVDEEHADAIENVIEAMAEAPDEFVNVHGPLASPDVGAFTVDVARGIFAAWKTLRPLARELEEAAQQFSDHVKVIGAELRDPIEHVCVHIVFELAETNPRIKEIIAKSKSHWDRWVPRRFRGLGASKLRPL